MRNHSAYPQGHRTVTPTRAMPSGRQERVVAHVITTAQINAEVNREQSDSMGRERSAEAGRMLMIINPHGDAHVDDLESPRRGRTVLGAK